MLAAVQTHYTSSGSPCQMNGATAKPEEEARERNINKIINRADSTGHTSTVELFLSKCASIEATNKDNYILLQLARRYDSTRVCSGTLETYKTISG